MVFHGMVVRLESPAVCLFVVSDIDECTTEADDCDTNAACTNNMGSFACACNDGYTGDGKTGDCQGNYIY